MIDSTARLDPVDLSAAGRARKVADLEARVHDRALAFPTVPIIDQLPALLRDYVAGRHLTSQVGIGHRRVYSSMAYLAAFIAGNLPRASGDRPDLYRARPGRLPAPAGLSPGRGQACPQTLLSLRPECAVPILLDRTDEVAALIGTAGRSETEELRHVLRRTRTIEGT